MTTEDIEGHMRSLLSSGKVLLFFSVNLIETKYNEKNIRISCFTKYIVCIIFKT